MQAAQSPSRGPHRRWRKHGGSMSSRVQRVWPSLPATSLHLQCARKETNLPGKPWKHLRPRLCSCCCLVWIPFDPCALHTAYSSSTGTGGTSLTAVQSATHTNLLSAYNICGLHKHACSCLSWSVISLYSNLRLRLPYLHTTPHSTLTERLLHLGILGKFRSHLSCPSLKST